MDVRYAYDRKLQPQFGLSNFTGNTKQNGCYSLDQLYRSGTAATNEDGFVVGRADEWHLYYGLVMVGGHRSIQRALYEAGDRPLIQTNCDFLVAYWGEKKVTFGKNLTWLMITGNGFFAMNYPNCQGLNDYRIMETATPRRLSEALTCIWPKYFKVA